MKPADREALRRQMEARVRQILAESHAVVADARDALAVRADVFDSGEESVLDEILAARADFTERERQLLVAIRAAFERLHDGSYGLCVDCGQVIALARLRAVPWALRCAADQQRLEETSGGAGHTI